MTPIVYTTGGWVTNQLNVGYVDNYYYGIRRFPYAVKTTLGANGKPLDSGTPENRNLPPIESGEFFAESAG